MTQQSRAWNGVIEELSRDSEAVAWLSRAGPIARRLNDESDDDWPCAECGCIGCECDVPAYRGAFDTEGRH